MNSKQNSKVNKAVSNAKQSIKRFSNYRFLFTELVKRDFKQKYKRTTLGMLWSILNPLLTLLVMRIVFLEFFGRNTPHYTIYLFAGNIVMAFYKEATKTGMTSLVYNQAVISKINIPKYLFLFSRNVSAFVNFVLTLGVFFIFCLIDKIQFGWHFLFLIFPIVAEVLMNIGIGMILSCWYIFFRDTSYLYDVFLTLLTYLSAIFYTVDRWGDRARIFLLNPVYVLIKYVRLICIDGSIPSLEYHLLMFGYSFFFLSIGFFMYKKYNHQFIYYL